MPFVQQCLLAVLTGLFVPVFLKVADILLVAAKARFGNVRRRSYQELDQDNWKLRDTLRRVNTAVLQLEDFQSKGNSAAVAWGIANLKGEIDPLLLRDPGVAPAPVSAP